MSEDDRIIFRKQTIWVPEEIPEGAVICPDCKGTGEVRYRWGGPGSKDYINCFTCSGEAYLDKEHIAMYKRIGT